MRDANQSVFPVAQALTVPAEYTLTVQDPSQRSQGYIYQIGFPSGLFLLIEHYDLQEELFVETGAFEVPALQFGFEVAGNNEVFEIEAGKNYVQSYFDDFFPSGLGTHYSGGQKLAYVELFLDPRQYFSTGLLDGLPRSLQQYLETDNVAFLNHYRRGQTTPEMQWILQQMLFCPFTGPTRALYLEAKCTELMALRLEPTTAGERELLRSPHLKPADIECIYHARTILQHQFTHPPSLLALAKQVGLNDYKLKLGFKQIMGTTVFGYIWERRMQQARQLFHTGQSVQMVAAQVGYACPSRFTVAFKKRFGVTPTQYLSHR
ncbi:MAG: helix-turn-helix transcriptional regulator [Acaryochloris sp. SU_5_25]|nr:helix-turn-helix transcriptional regulator [Acaryochloris sp. SU_5_25]